MTIVQNVQRRLLALSSLCLMPSCFCVGVDFFLSSLVFFVEGSVALKMARSLELGGIRTGLFVSPHVSCFRERMQVNGEMISEAGVEDVLAKVRGGVMRRNALSGCLFRASRGTQPPFVDSLLCSRLFFSRNSTCPTVVSNVAAN